MKKLFPTWIDASAESLDFILVSGGRIGLQLKLSLQDLLQLTNGRIATIIKM